MITNFFKKNKKGFSTLEILLSLTIIILSLTAVIGLIFGNQTTSIDTSLNNEGVYLAQEQIEDARAQARADFGGLVLGTSVDTSDPIFKKTLTITQGSDAYTKNLLSKVDWVTDGNRPQTISLLTTLTYWLGKAAGDICQVPENSDWSNPKVVNSSNPIAIHSGNRVTSLAVKKPYVFLTASGQDGSSGNGHNFYTVNVSDPSAPQINLSKALVGSELSAVSISGNYAYVMGFTHNSPGDEQGDVYYQNGYAYVGIKHGETITNGQFYIIDISDPSTPKVVSGSRINLPSDSKIPSAHQSDEFLIFNVTNPANPTFVGGIANETAFGSKGINAIQIYNNVAVIGTEINNLIVVDLTTKTAPSLMTPFNSGSHIYGLFVNSKGRILAGGKGKLFMLNAASMPISQIDMIDPGDGGKRVSGIMSSGGYAFLGTQDSSNTFIVANIADDGTLSGPISHLALGGSGAPNGGLGCEGNTVYMALYPGDSDVLKVIAPTPPLFKIDSGVLKFNKKDMTFTLTNNGSGSAYISKITITWPGSTNGTLSKIIAGAKTIYTGPAVSPSTISTFAAGTTVANRTIAAGGNLNLKFSFLNNASANSNNYSITIEFDANSSHTISIP